MDDKIKSELIEYLNHKIKCYYIKSDNLIKHIQKLGKDSPKYVMSQACENNLKLLFKYQEYIEFYNKQINS
jgi:hypothetical protein